ncbi:MAG: beta-N-acetylhexosaminidase [Pseudomonadota bacterium]
MRNAMIVGLAGPTLQKEEAAFLQEVRPAGLIIFARNVQDPDQLRRLIKDARSALAEPDCLVLVDQEGGRVQRLRRPHWTALPAAARYGKAYCEAPERALQMLAQVSSLCAAELRDVGINTNCAPCLDLPINGAHDVIGDRAYGRSPSEIARFGQTVAESFMNAGVLPVMKHVPGHGRAMVDSHKQLPVVHTKWSDLNETDIEPFRLLNHVPAAMTAHVVYSDIDPEAPATTSKTVIANVIRDEIGFDGLLMSDDLSMSALKGTISERAAAVRGAGCDLVLHCNGNLEEMRAAADQAGNLSGRSEERFRAACAITQKDVFPLDLPELREQARETLAELL